MFIFKETDIDPKTNVILYGMNVRSTQFVMIVKDTHQTSISEF